MSYLVRHTYGLGAAYSGKTLHAQIGSYVSDVWTPIGSEITTGFYEVPGSDGLFEHELIVPDNASGFMRVYASDNTSFILFSWGINPAEFEKVLLTETAVNGLPTAEDIRVEIDSNSTKLDDTVTSRASQVSVDGLHNLSTTDIGSLLTTYDGATQTDLDSAKTDVLDSIAALHNLSAVEVLSYILQGDKSLLDALIDIWSSVVGNITLNQNVDPVTAIHKDISGDTRFTHNISDISRTHT